VVARVFALLAALISGAAGSAAAAPAFIPLLAPGDTVPAIPLRTQDGRPFTLADLRGNAIALSFIYTRCRDPRMCPLVSAKFSRAQARLGSLPVRLVVLTLDPQFDTPAVLARYGRAFGQDTRRWTLVTGSPEAASELAARFGIATTIAEPGVILHTEGLMLLDPAGRLVRAIYGNDWSAADLVDDARAMLPGRSDALLGFRAWLTSAMETCGRGNLALGGTAMLAILAACGAIVGTIFWLAFRGKAVAGT